jgi:hypothetical protein
LEAIVFMIPDVGWPVRRRILKMQDFGAAATALHRDDVDLPVIDFIQLCVVARRT